LERKINKYLIDWKNGQYRKPLILQGARRTGKTYSILAFGREQYANIAYFNFETNPTLRKTFDENIKPAYLIPILSNLCGQSIIKDETLIVFDEVQLCERALTSLKYFCELAPEYHIIAVGVSINRETYSFPVGKVDIKTLYPLDLEEFLLAFCECQLIAQIRKCFETLTPISVLLHERALSYYRQYLVVGGMPECVEKYIATMDFTQLRHTQALILNSYLNGMIKYNKENEIEKTRLVYDNITAQLSKKDKRFQYKIKFGAHAAEFENAIERLAMSGNITRIYRVDRPREPLENNRNINDFKVYISDVGLLFAKKDIVVEDMLNPSNDLINFKSGMIENYVCGQLIATGYRPYFWMNDRGAEVEFVIESEGRVLPIEVKAAENTNVNSLTVYINSYKPNYSIKLSGKNFGFAAGKKTIPLYAAFCL